MTKLFYFLASLDVQQNDLLSVTTKNIIIAIERRGTIMAPSSITNRF